MQPSNEVEDKIKELFLNNDVIEDDLIHGLADDLGMDAHSLENIVYKMFKTLLVKEQEEKEL